MRVLVTGATGYIGGRLVPELLAAGHEVRCAARTPAKLDAQPWRSDVEVVRGDATDEASMAAALGGCEAAYYLLHSMGDGGAAGFAEQERETAATFRAAAATAGAGQIVYLGGLGDDADPHLSPHLRSRHDVGRVLAEGPVPVTELRAAIIIGSGSASFEMLRNLTEVLPVMVTPRWVDTRCQPIAVRDVLAYLVGVLGLDAARGRVLEVGGPDVLSYHDVMQAYADMAGLRRRVVVKAPVLTPSLSSHWVGLVTPIPAGLAKPLVGSLLNEVVVRDPAIRALVPHDTVPFREALELALEHERTPGPAGPSPADPSWAGATVLEDVQTVDVDAPPAAVYRTVAALGGTNGWLVATALWSIRGWLDRLVGGVGARPRRHPTELDVGDEVDFWRVERAEPDRLLRLRAEMRLPGEAWLEFAIEPAPAGGSTLVQRASFAPRGLWGRAYWYALVPFHAVIFGPLARRLAQRASTSKEPVTTRQ